MADIAPPQPLPPVDLPPPRQSSTAPPPPPLTDVRVRGPAGRGLNKPAILLTAGGAVAIVLLLASNGLTSNSAKRPADAKPIMSDPARPEMAQTAVRGLPDTYPEAAAREAARLPAQPPVLGPPLPGDVAAFAPDQPDRYDAIAYDRYEPTYEPDEEPDPAIEEARQAERSALFFALRQQPKQDRKAPQPVQAQQDQLTSLMRPDTVTPATSSPGDAVLFPGTVISASLVTGIISESPGPVIAQVSQTVYDSATGRVPVIPQGARLIGDYKSSTRYGQSRVAILWSHLIMPDGEQIALNEMASDPSGAAGVSGKVDNHWPDVFGAAALGTLINVGVAATEDPILSYDGVGATSRDPVDDAVAEGAQRSASIVSNRVVDRSLALPPTIRIEAGQRISIMVRRPMTSAAAGR
jgi:type IV secretory pathway VirB10-like protein